RLLEGTIGLAPPDVSFGGRLADDEFVVRGAACVLPSVDNQRPEVGDQTFAAGDGLLVEFGSREVPIDVIDMLDSVVGDAIRTRVPTRLLHDDAPFTGVAGSRSVIAPEMI